MRDIYCISGLGADQRIFSRLKIPGINLLPVPWLKPERFESIGSYAARLKAQIPAAKPVIMGVSFGGMMAVEIAKLFTSCTVILVSSIGDCRQLPAWMRFCGLLHLDVLLPRWRRISFWPGVSLPERYFMGVESDDDAALVRHFKFEADPRFLKWAVNKVLNWKNEWQPAALFHVHGGRDRMFPLRRVQPTQIVADGGHLMIYNRSQAMSEILAGICAGIATNG